MLRGYGATALSGHRVLGTPIGTPGFITAFVDDAVAAALAAVPLLDSLLLQPNPYTASALGAHAPDERACLIRSCLHSRVRHLSLCFLPSLPPFHIALKQHFEHVRTVNDQLCQNMRNFRCSPPPQRY